MKYYIIAGEKSGDLHGANLIRAIKAIQPSSEFRYCGGEEMLKVDPNIAIHYKKMAFMGFVEIVMNLSTIKQNIKKVKQDLLDHKIDQLILIDYPGFNLRIAEFAKQHNIKVHYYISPKVWAWKEGRVKKIKAFVDHMYLILPFEEDFYAKHGYKATYVGNPLLDAIADYKDKQKEIAAHEGAKPILALLPGSRKMEVKNILPEMIGAATQFPKYEVVVAGVSSLDSSFYAEARSAGFSIWEDQTYDLLDKAEIALVTSGTATLETALFEVPQVVCYKAHAISIWIAKRLVKIKFISLVNLIMDKLVVKELIQEDLNAKSLVKELKSIEKGSEGRTKMLADYALLREKMGTPGASEKVAQQIVSNA